MAPSVKKAAFVVAALLLLAAFGPVSATGVLVAGESVRASSEPMSPVSVTVSVTEARVRPGERVWFNVRVRNAADAAVGNVRISLKSTNGGVVLPFSSFVFKSIGPRATGVRSLRVRVSRRAQGRAWLTAAIPGKQDTARLQVIYLGPCRDPIVSAKLFCPDFRVARPSEMYVDRRTRPGRTLLRSTNDIQSRGQGPMELRGRRDRPRTMAVMQAIQRRGGGYKLYPVQARLGFHNVGAEFGGSYWKVRSPLRFELWTVGAKGRVDRRVKVGPKQFYCFRDLVRTKPGPRSPSSVVYPACNQNPNQREVTLGTSVGWSDIYPSTYDEQWIDVTGLRGCFAYVLRVDPLGLLYESGEGNNVSQRRVRLPFRGDSSRGC